MMYGTPRVGYLLVGIVLSVIGVPILAWALYVSPSPVANGLTPSPANRMTFTRPTEPAPATPLITPRPTWVMVPDPYYPGERQPKPTMDLS